MYTRALRPLSWKNNADYLVYHYNLQLRSLGIGDLPKLCQALHEVNCAMFLISLTIIFLLQAVTQIMPSIPLHLWSRALYKPHYHPPPSGRRPAYIGNQHLLHPGRFFMRYSGVFFVRLLVVFPPQFLRQRLISNTSCILATSFFWAR